MRTGVRSGNGRVQPRRCSYRHVEFLLFSIVNFTTDSEEKDHGYTRQEVSREVRRQDRK
jgi:hypothetical protein